MFKKWLQNKLCKIGFHKKETINNSGIVNNVRLFAKIIKCTNCNKSLN